MNLRLLQLASPALPVGAYSYSQGLEAAVESGIVSDAASAAEWIGDVLDLSMGSMEAPVLLRLIAAWEARDLDAVRRWNDEFIASRETAELRAETLQMGYSLRNLLRDLAVIPAPDPGIRGQAPSGIQAEPQDVAYPTMYAYAVAHWHIDAGEALEAYLFAWAENQVLAALKTVPLGQTEGQRMLLALGEAIARIAARARVLGDSELTNFAPGLALASARHETQYSRIFRS
jgi:urease accessory protein